MNSWWHARGQGKMVQRSMAVADTGVGNAMRAATLGIAERYWIRSSGAGRPSVERPWLRVFRRRSLVFELLQHRLILGAQRCRGLHSHAGRYGVTRIALARSADLTQHGVELSAERLHRDRDAAQLAQ